MAPIKFLKSPPTKINEADTFQIPEPPVAILSAVQTPINQCLDLHLPSLAFSSPAFQASLQTPQIGLISSPLVPCFSPNPNSIGFSLPSSMTDNQEDHGFSIPMSVQSAMKEPVFREPEDRGKSEFNEFTLFSERFLQS